MAQVRDDDWPEQPNNIYMEVFKQASRIRSMPLFGGSRFNLRSLDACSTPPTSPSASSPQPEPLTALPA